MEYLISMLTYTFVSLCVLALVLSLFGKKYTGKRLDVVVTGILSLIVVIFLSYLLYRYDLSLSIDLGLFSPIKISCDMLSFLIVMNICIVGIAALISSYEYLDIYKKKGYLPYYFCLLVFIYSMAMLALLRNWFWFLLFFEIMTLSSYFLVGYEYYNEEARRIAWNYFVVMHTLCSVFLILGVTLTYVATRGVLDFDVIINSFCLPLSILYLIGFMVKSGLVPFHFWLPDAHPVAPSPASALLSGCMVEIGIYGYYRFLVQLAYIQPIIGWIILILGVMSSLISVASYPRQNDIKRLFAWSTIDNIGWMFILLAFPLVTNNYDLLVEYVPILLGTYILFHGLAKAAAFISSGGIIYCFETRNIYALKSAYEFDRTVVGALIASMFALEGVPPFGFFWAKLSILHYCFIFSPILAIIYTILWCLAFVVFLKYVHVFIKKNHVENLSVIRPKPKYIVFSSSLLLAILLIYGFYPKYIWLFIK